MSAQSITTHVERDTCGLKGYSTPGQGWEKTERFGEPTTYTNPRFGTLAIGMHASGKFDQWCFHEINGGGLLVVPYLGTGIDDISVVLLRVNRDNLVGDDDYEAIGGFHDGHEAAFGGAMKECLEEAGLLPSEMEPASGRYFASNRAFFYLADEGEGNKIFSWKINDGQRELIEEDPSLIIVPWREAVGLTRDALTRAAIATVLAGIPA